MPLRKLRRSFSLVKILSGLVGKSAKAVVEAYAIYITQATCSTLGVPQMLAVLDEELAPTRHCELLRGTPS